MCITLTEYKNHLIFHVVQKIIANTKYISQASNQQEDDCSCGKCENLELLPTGVRKVLLATQNKDQMIFIYGTHV